MSLKSTERSGVSSMNWLILKNGSVGARALGRLPKSKSELKICPSDKRLELKSAFECFVSECCLISPLLRV